MTTALEPLYDDRDGNPGPTVDDLTTPGPWRIPDRLVDDYVAAAATITRDDRRRIATSAAYATVALSARDRARAAAGLDDLTPWGPRLDVMPNYGRKPPRVDDLAGDPAHGWPPGVTAELWLLHEHTARTAHATATAREHAARVAATDLDARRCAVCGTVDPDTARTVDPRWTPNVTRYADVLLCPSCRDAIRYETMRRAHAARGRTAAAWLDRTASGTA